MRRRDFLESVGVAAAGSLMLSDSADASSIPQRIEFAKSPADRPLDIKLVVKPVFAPLIHSDLWQGPCRPGGKSQRPEKTLEYLLENDPSALWAMAGSRTPEQEKADAEADMKRLGDTLKKDHGRNTLVLDPMFMPYSEDFWIRPEQLAELEAEKDKVDAYLVSGSFINYPGTIIAEAVQKPVVLLGGGFVARDGVAYMKARGLEGHAVFNAQELNHLLLLMKTRKVFQRTRILIITDRGLPPVAVRSCIDVNLLKNRFGIGSHLVSYREFSGEMDRVLKSKEWSAKAEQRAEQLIKNAAEIHIDSQYVKRSFEFYYAVKNLMQKYSCNAFTVDCFELCASRLADKYQITPCSVHTLLKDEGHASACEGDLNALLAMRLLMSAANKSSFMGNVMSLKDQLVLNHSVPGIKMAGYDKPDLPYHLRHFVESGWGTKVMIDFMQPEEKIVTLARVDPLGTKICLAKGEIVACSGFNKGTLIGCSLAAHIKVPDSREVLRKLEGFGSHFSMVYGDYTREVNELAGMMGLQVVYAT